MHAIIRQGDGKYYVSAVFGFFRRIDSSGCGKEHLRQFNRPHWIVWDEKKGRLIRWLSMVPNTEYLIPQILIVDSDHSGWNTNEEGEGCVGFLTRTLLDSFLDAEQQPREILDLCRQMDAGYTYAGIQEIRTRKDIEDLEWVSGGFHDARIIKEEHLEDGTLHVRFDGTWGCEIEVWFSGDSEYDTSSRDPEDCDPYWSGSTVLLQDGFVYFADEEDMTVEKIGTGYCRFKARHMRYWVVPD